MCENGLRSIKQNNDAPTFSLKATLYLKKEYRFIV
jgi:hypothetical protein